MKEYTLYEDHVLIQCISRGDEKAFTELYDRYKNKLYSFSLDLTGSREKAGDLVHDVFLKIWEQRHSLDGREVFASYLYTMIRNFCIDHLRRKAKETLIIAELSKDNPPTVSTPETSLLYKDIKEKVEEAVNHLPARQKEVFILHRVNGLKHDEIASRLNLSVSTVENHFGRALGGIRQYLNMNYPEMMILGFMIGISFLPYFFSFTGYFLFPDRLL